MKEEQLHETEGGEEEGDEAAVEAMEQLGQDICHTEETVSLEGETHPVEGVEDKGEVEQSGELHDGVHSLSSGEESFFLVLPHMFFYVFFNFRWGLFSSLFGFEHFFCCKIDHL